MVDNDYVYCSCHLLDRISASDWEEVIHSQVRAVDQETNTQ